MTWKNKPLDRSLPCNPHALVFHRKRRDWTQAELAQVVGYTERVIVKAEAGKPIRLNTIEDLAEALSNDEVKVAPDDLVARPIDMAKQLIFGSYVHRHDTFNKIKHFLHPDIELIFDGDPNVVPFAGHHRGLDEVEKALGIFFAVLDAPADCDYESTHQFLVNENNPNEVIVWGKAFFHPVGQPDMQINLQIRCLFENGRMKVIDDRFDTMQAHKMFVDVAPE